MTGARVAHLIMPMALCFALGALFSLAILGLNLPDRGTVGPHSAFLTAGGPGRGQAASIGAYLTYRAHAVLAAVIALAVIGVAVAALRCFVRDRATFRIVGLVLFAQMAVAGSLAMGGGAPMSRIARSLTCIDGSKVDAWAFCAQPVALPGLNLDLSFNGWVNGLCSLATCAIVFAILIVARADRPAALPPVIGSRERCLTLLLIAASALLVAVMLRDGAYLRWAFADVLAVKDPPGDVLAYVTGSVTFNGAMGTALLGAAWYVALLLTGARGDDGEAGEAGGAKAGGYSAYNVSAILAPILSALASNMLSGL